MSDATLEVNFDGLIGPSHTYAGLSEGNFASQRNRDSLSNPRAAALQGLEKMRHLIRKGLVQGVLPPLPRPAMDFLAQAGFQGTDEDMLDSAGRHAPGLLRAAYSASAMWAANAATVSPSADTRDGLLHFTPANLTTMLHRSLEVPDTVASLIAIFGSPDHFVVHQPLPGHAAFADEGAANHVRLCRAQDEDGVALFVYGRDARGPVTGPFPARQARLASESVARAHGLASERIVFARQSEQAIAAGAFHNDVVCVGALNTLFLHEQAFEDCAGTLQALRRACDGLFDLRPVIVPAAEVSLSDAVASYLFNSQLLQCPDEDRLVLLAPIEVRDHPATRAYCDRLVQSNGPIGRIDYIDVRESMRNGGGPACLRLRVVMTAAERAACHAGVLLTEDRIDALGDVVRTTYRDSLSPADLMDPAFARDCQLAREAVLDVLDLAELY